MADTFKIINTSIKKTEIKKVNLHLQENFHKSMIKSY